MKSTVLAPCLALAAIVASLVASLAGNLSAQDQPPEEPQHTHRWLQGQLDDAPAGSTVDFGQLEFVTLDKPLQVSKPLWIRGLRLQLPPALARTSLVEVRSSGVRITDSSFRGNADTVPQDGRASLVNLHAGQFSVERCVFENSAKNGLTIDPGDSGTPLAGGVVRDIVGRGVVRDVVSLSGGPNGAIVRDVLVENVHATDSVLRGAVEVSDGSEDVTVRSVTAERCVYAVDFQDHDEPTDVNHNVLIEDVRARRCRHAVRTATEPKGHTGLTLRDIVAIECDVPVQVSYVHGVTIDGLRVKGRVRDATEWYDRRCAVQIKGCQNVVLRDAAVVDGGDLLAVVHAIDVEGLHVDGLSVEGQTQYDYAVLHDFASEKIVRPRGDEPHRRIHALAARQFAVGARLLAPSQPAPQVAKPVAGP